MKTRDAFAFRGFDPERILQRPYFRHWRNKYHVRCDLSDAKILASIMHVETHLPLIELENAVLTELMILLEEFQKLIQRHANAMDGRLERYRRAVSLQDRLDRVDEMTHLYIIDVARAVGTLAVEVKERWQTSERTLQTAYRKRFGERLKKAREVAGLTRQQFAAKCNLSMQQVHYYENGQREPSLTSLKRFAWTLKVSIDWLLE